jgi:hypothetical protein
MRRALGLLIVAMLFVVGSSTALAATPQKITIRALIAQGGWDIYDEATGAGESGVVQVARAQGKTTAYLFASKGELVLCEGGDTPDDPFDDFYGFQGTETVGEGPAKLTLGRTYSSAKAWGTVTAEVFTFNECTGDEGSSTTKTVKVSLDLTGISPVVHEKSRSTISIPSRLRTKMMVKADSRDAAGTVVVGTRTIDTGGVIGQLFLRASIAGS